MTLEFRPPFQIDPNAPTRADRSLASLNQTINGIGQEALQYSQQQKENKIRQAMLDLQRQQGAREQGIYNYEYGDPSTGGSSATAPSPSGSLQQGTTGPQPMSFPPPSGHDQPMSYADNVPTSYPQVADAGTPDTGWKTPQPLDAQVYRGPMPGTDLTSHFNAWKGSGMPPQYNHPELGGKPSPMDFMGQYSQIMNMPGAKRRGEAASIFKNVGEGAKAFAESQPGINTWSPEQYGALRSGDPAALGKAFPNGIPRQAGEAGLMSGRFGTTQAFKQTEMTDKELEQAQSGYNKDQNVQKAQGVLDKVSQAIPLLQAGTIDNATAKQALTTAMTYMATGGQRVNDVELRQFGGAHTLTNRMGQWLKGIDSGTLTPRDQQDMTQVLGIFKNAAQKTLQDSGMRYARQLSQRTGSKPEDEFKRVTGADFTQGPAGGQQFTHTATDAKGNKVGWDGQKWVPIQ